MHIALGCHLDDYILIIRVCVGVGGGGGVGANRKGDVLDQGTP
jgi:hypothetical protein